MEARKVNFLAGDSSRILLQLLLVVFASGLVRIRSQVMQELEKLLTLAPKQSVVRESLDRAHRNPLGLGWTND